MKKLFTPILLGAILASCSSNEPSVGPAGTGDGTEPEIRGYR